MIWTTCRPLNYKLYHISSIVQVINVKRIAWSDHLFADFLALAQNTSTQAEVSHTLQLCRKI